MKAQSRLVGCIFVFLWFLIGGVAHFVATEGEVRLAPQHIPWPFAAVWISGVLEILGSVVLLFAATRRAAGMGLFAARLQSRRPEKATRDPARGLIVPDSGMTYTTPRLRPSTGATKAS